VVDAIAYEFLRQVGIFPVKREGRLAISRYIEQELLFFVRMLFEREEGNAPLGCIAFQPREYRPPGVPEAGRVQLKATPGSDKTWRTTKGVLKTLLATSVDPKRALELEQHHIGGFVRRGAAGMIYAEFCRDRIRFLVGSETVGAFQAGQFRNYDRTRVTFPSQVGHFLREPGVCDRLRSMLERSQSGGKGATIVLGAFLPETVLHAHEFTTPASIEENEDLFTGLSRVDGALFFDHSMALLAFGAILAGQAKVAGRAERGSRYNSALNYSANNPECVVIVVSSDGPICYLQAGQELK